MIFYPDFMRCSCH